jgi:probable HAF family extracellular repeat protein
MTKRKCFVALLAASSIGCLCGAGQSPAQNLGQAALPSTPQSQKYRLQVLPNEGGLSNPLSINNRDWVAGLVNPPSEQPEHPGLWRRTENSQSANQSWRLTDLGTLGGPNAAIESPNKNEIGWLAGASETAAQDPNAENFCGFDCAPLPTCSFTNICRGFLWRGETNKMIALPPLPGGTNSHATASNNNRQIAGFAENGVMGQTCALPQVFLYEGVVWTVNASGEPTIQRTLPPLPGDAVSAAIGMNDTGIVVGASGACASPPPLHAVLWKNGGSPHALGTLGGSGSQAWAPNEIGQVVGISYLPGDAVTHAYIWQEGVGMKDLGSLLPDDTQVFPQSINNRGEVVGWSCGPSEPTLNPSFPCIGFYWRNGVMIDLNKHLTKPTTLQICCANDINDSGEIPVAAFDASFNGGDYVPAVLIPEQQDQQGQDQQSTAENLPQQSAATVQRSPNDLLGRFSPRLRGWNIAR